MLPAQHGFTNNGFVFPLWLKVDDVQSGRRNLFGGGKRLNLGREFLTKLSSVRDTKPSGEFGVPAGLTPEDIFNYTYSVLHSPSYRSRYAEFLKIDFPRLPLTSNRELFSVLARMGDELVAPPDGIT